MQQHESFIDPLMVDGKIDIHDTQYELEDAFELTKQCLISRFRQLIQWLEEGDLLPSPQTKRHHFAKRRSLDGMVFFPDGDWYSNKTCASGNIITLISYFTGMDVFQAVEWAWESFIPCTDDDVHYAVDVRDANHAVAELNKIDDRFPKNRCS